MPVIFPVAVGLLAASAAKHAMPKSVIFTVRSVVSTTLAGSMSQAGGRLGRDDCRLGRGQDAAHGAFLGRIPAVDEFHDQVRLVIV